MLTTSKPAWSPRYLCFCVYVVMLYGANVETQFLYATPPYSILFLNLFLQLIAMTLQHLIRRTLL